MYNQKEYFSVTNKDFNIGDSSQAEDEIGRASCRERV